MLKKTNLHVGDSAPDFVIADVNGDEFNLAEFKGKKSLVLVFLRYLGCTLCQIILQQFKNSYSEFYTKNAEVAIIIQSPASTIQESGDVNVFPFRLIPDPKELIYRQYGVGSGNLLMIPQSILKAFIYSIKGYRSGKQEGNTWQLPGDFVIDKEGIIRFVYIGKNMGDNLPPGKLLSYIGTE